MKPEKLLPYLNETHERVGFILKDGKVVEVENICEDTASGFEVKGTDILFYLDKAVATWHTHPGTTSNLSTHDHYAFRNFPNWKHYIVGTDGVACYVIENGAVIREA
jgi:proteasome lid subunit RPN8/RPN11